MFLLHVHSLRWLALGFAVLPGHHAAPVDDAGRFGKNKGNCVATAETARQTCKTEAARFLWGVITSCLALTEDAARQACIGGAHTVREKAKDACTEQYKTRLRSCETSTGAPQDPAGTVPRGPD